MTLPTSHPHREFRSTMKDRAIFQDKQGRGWLVEVLYGHPAPTERGIYAARFRCPEEPAEPVRLGYLEIQAVEDEDQELLREFLEESRPGQEIG
jgi:hypothetical protein